MKIFRLLFLLFSIYGFTQVTNSGRPLSWKIETQVEKINLPSFDIKSIEIEDALNDEKGVGPWRFGYEHVVDLGIENHGIWTSLPNGDRFWLLNINSKGAKTMNFVFDEFYIPEGGKLYFYNKDKTDLLGAYTHSQNRNNMVFGSWLIDGEDIYIEYFEPSDKLGQGRLHISKAVHGYRSISDYEKEAKDLNDSGACNLDVDCSIGSDFDSIKDELKKSVALIVVGGNGFCTGSLINNTSNDGTPYFLTANHCLGGSVGNWAFRFNWRSPNPVCATGSNSTNGTFNQTASGAVLRANNSGSDVALLEITAPLPASWDLVWAGWDRTSTPANFTVGIHHPSGDIMKVCRDNDSPTTSFNAGSQNWFINEWETGVTEPGSSGSPLYNQDGRIIGQLYGGLAACSGTVNNQQFDYYGRFDVSWDNGSSASTRLRDWLDPNGSGETVIDQFPPAQQFNLDARIVTTDVPSEICDSTIQPTFEVQNSGINPLTSVILIYQLNNEPPVNINWTGNLLNGESAVIATPMLTLSEDNNTLTSFLSSPNGNPDEFLNNNSSTLNIIKTPSYMTTSVILNMLTDDYGNETTWEFRNEDTGTLLDQGGPYPDNVSITENFSVSPDTCYSFTIFDSADDGICCGFGIGNYSLSTTDGTTIINSGDFGSVETTNLRIIDNLSTSAFSEITFSVYPNPVTDIIHINTNDELSEIILFDISGKKVKSTTSKSINIDNLSKGIYFLKLAFSYGKVFTKKIIKK